MKKYRIKYWLNGNLRVKTLKASSETEARIMFFMKYECDDIKSIEEVN